MLSMNEALMRAAGIQKAAGGSINLDTTNFNGVLVRDEVLPMIDLTRKHNDWLGAISSFTRRRRKGTVSIYRLTEEVMEHVGEQDPRSVTTTPPNTSVPYETEKHHAQVVISREDIEEASLDVDGDHENKLVDMFTTQIGNNTADVTINGNTAYATAPANRRERMLKGIDGLYVLLAAGANVYDRGGAAFDDYNFDALWDRVPQHWRNDKKSMRWMYADRIDTAYRRQLKARNTGLGDMAFGSTATLAPQGIKPILVPQMPDNEGPTAIAPTSCTDETTYINFVLTTLVTAGDPATAAAGVGRKFLVTCTATGQSEVCIGILDTTLRINTAGLLGQTTVSTNAAHYTVRPYDETRILLGDPKGITIVWHDEWVFYREWNPKLDQVEIDIYLEFDVVVPVPEMYMMLNGVAAPPLGWTSA